jgi:hypothetical protein
LRWKHRVIQQLIRCKDKLADHRIVEHQKKQARRSKATAKKLLWLARQDFDKMTPEARRAAERLLKSPLAVAWLDGSKSSNARNV